MKKLVFLGLISTIPVLNAYAEENQHYAFLDTLAENSFFSDSKLDLTVKNYWKYLKEDEAQSKEVHNAWGQGFGFDYKSGYLADFIVIQKPPPMEVVIVHVGLCPFLLM